jgi:multisubunit Na+/H+ antiporter MnhC subunit
LKEIVDFLASKLITTAMVIFLITTTVFTVSCSKTKKSQQPVPEEVSSDYVAYVKEISEENQEFTVIINSTEGEVE